MEPEPHKPNRIRTEPLEPQPMVRPLRTEPFSNRTAYEPEPLVNRDRLGTKTAVSGWEQD